MSTLAQSFGLTLKTLAVPHLQASQMPLYAQIGHALWLAMEQGHTALSDQAIRQWVGQEQVEQLNQLASSAALQQSDSAIGPLVCHDGFWYLQRYARIESRLANALTALNQAVPAGAGTVDIQLNIEQQSALSKALARQLLVLSGGPGTGKTFTIAKILSQLKTTNPQWRIAGSAPTGKAASRLGQSCAGLISWSGTVHRLLRLPRDLNNQLDFDVVVVDEATMLDAQLADSLFAALASHTRLILAGDHNQLSSVLSGAVFAQCCDMLDAILFLVQSRRFAEDSGIAALADAVKVGRVEPEPEKYLKHDVRWYQPPAQVTNAWFALTVAGFDRLQDAVDHDADDDTLIAALGEFKVLCSSHEGLTGVHQTNLQLSRAVRARALLRRPRKVFNDSVWFDARIVMVTRNDPIYDLSNGDMGVCVFRNNGWHVVFEGGLVVAATGLSHITDAWAVTVHKAQGSEYNGVLVSIPDANSPQLRRELLYTAITRAKKQVTLFGDWHNLVLAAQTQTERFSGLAARLRALSRP
jgi:exodeoxyribonuclease V alpha subunit